MNLKTLVVFVLVLLVLGSPGAVDLGQATVGEAVSQMVICTALIILIYRWKEVLERGKATLSRMYRAISHVPCNMPPLCGTTRRSQTAKRVHKAI